MHERDTAQETRKSNTQQLDFLEQTILNSFRWQEAWKLADEQKNAAAKPLRTRLTTLLHLVMNNMRVKGRGQAHKQCSGNMECQCLNLR